MISVLRISDLRNYSEATFEPAAGLSVVVGGNGSGKSSLLEACGLFATLSSARAGSLRVLVRDDLEEGGASLESETGGSLQVRVRNGRSVLRIGGSPAQAKDFLGRFRAVLFTPEDLDLVRGEPALRRRALDALIVQLRPAHRAALRDYERALRQRNAALRDGLSTQASLYAEPLAVAGASVLEHRRRVGAELSAAAEDLYPRLAERGALSMRYVDSSDAPDDVPLAEHLAAVYERCLGEDLDRGRTTVGPHRDDLEIELEGRPARWFASRGEQRSATLALRLAELGLLPDAVLLLDDVLSELDEERRRRVFEVAGEVQTVVTATDATELPGSVQAEALWRVCAGRLERAS